MNKRVFWKKVVTVAFIGFYLITFSLYSLRTYNELLDMEHFLEVAHGRLLVEMQRRQVVISGCENAVAM